MNKCSLLVNMARMRVPEDVHAPPPWISIFKLNRRWLEDCTKPSCGHSAGSGGLQEHDMKIPGFVAIKTVAASAATTKEDRCWR